MKKTICICICISLLAGCGKQPTQPIIERVIEKDPHVGTPVNFTPERETLSIPFPKIWAKMTNEPMIKGYRLPRPTFELGWWTVSSVNFGIVTALSLLALCAGKYLFFSKQQVNEVICKQDKPFELNAPANPIGVNVETTVNHVLSGNVGINPDATVHLDGEVKLAENQVIKTSCEIEHKGNVKLDPKSIVNMAHGQTVAIAPGSTVGVAPLGTFVAKAEGEFVARPAEDASIPLDNTKGIAVPVNIDQGTTLNDWCNSITKTVSKTAKIVKALAKLQADISVDEDTDDEISKLSSTTPKSKSTPSTKTNKKKRLKIEFSEDITPPPEPDTSSIIPEDQN
ncbi:MAG: hypothetical protein LE169_05500 [Endomicrobium sp.]|nr:hypothetical protein [Endomicrobium sp.]